MTDTTPEVNTRCPQAADATNAALGLHPAVHAQLQAAAGTMSQAWPAWTLPTQHWGIFSTGPPPRRG